MSVSYPQLSLRDVTGLDPTQTLILSVNNRHARRILSELSASLAPARKVIAVPDIIPLGAWLSQVADHLSFSEEHALASHTADGFGALYLWQHVIAETESEHALLDVVQAARLASEADRLLDDWRIDVRAEEETADYQRFLTWRSRYRERLAALDVEDSNLAYERICAAAVHGRLQLPIRNVVLAGFNDVPPRLVGLLDAIAQDGLTVFSLEHDSPHATTVQRVGASDTYAEWQLAAQWAASQLVSNPEGRYAIVAPQLEAIVPLAHRVLHGALNPIGLPYNIAVARPLAEWPLVRAAIAWLRIVARFSQARPCTTAELGQALLAGGCVAHNDEASDRALLDAHWRHQGVIELGARQFGQALSERVPQLATAWQDCMDRVGRGPAVAPVTAWAGHIRDVLQALGFPGYSGLDSHAWQTLESLDQLIDRLGHQAAVAGELSFGAVIGLMSRLAHDSAFQPQRDPRARLDVLGFLESEGGRWDGVWVLGLTDDVLPASPQPNPLLPLAALRRANAPRATPERELQWARSIYNSLMTSAPAIWLSHPLQEGERELRPSPFIAGLPQDLAEPRFESPTPWRMQYLVDDYGPAVQKGEVSKGGIALIDAQARNPLWAFVRFRLGAKALPDYARLADQSVRGQFLHRAMELLWSMLPDHDSLTNLVRQGRLDATVVQVTEQAADEWLIDFSPVLRKLEVQRSRLVLKRWLQLELQREPFEVLAVEQRERWTYGALELTVRLDRVDRLADGRLAIIDYKSGVTLADPRKNWMRERPIDLQLPFYAAVLADAQPGVSALILARLHARSTDANGVSDGDCGLGGIAHFTDWDAFREHRWEQVIERWRKAIEALAHEFSSGYAANTYVDKADINYCDVASFLRLNEEYPDDIEAAE